MEKKFDLYQVVAKCSDGDVLIGFDGENAFSICKAKAIQADFEKVGNEIQLKQLDKEKTKEIIIDKIFDVNNGSIAVTEYITKECTNVEIEDDFIEITTNGSFHYKLSSDGDTFIYADNGCSFSIDDATFAITLLEFISKYFWVIKK
jgi:hypothetical protein